MQKKQLTTTGLICLEDDYHIVYKVAKIEYKEWEDGTFKYVFIPFYNVIEMLPDRLFQGIPGLDLSLKKAVYERNNIVPTFISERTPDEHREDVRDLMEELGLQSLNRLEWLVRTDKRYSGDRLFVMPYDGKDYVTYVEHSMYDLVKKADSIYKKLLEIICMGDYLYADDLTIDDDSRTHYYNILMPIYMHEYNKKKLSKDIGIDRAKENNVYQGRRRIKIDPLLLNKIADDYLHGTTSAEKAAAQLNISKATFFRRLKELQ